MCVNCYQSEISRMRVMIGCRLRASGFGLVWLDTFSARVCRRYHLMNPRHADRQCLVRRRKELTADLFVMFVSFYSCTCRDPGRD